ncbi:LIPaSe related [Aphelenchoides fujianensis]|nr:LIPaSe related [Aphelenchoides fujianensis]
MRSSLFFLLLVLPMAGGTFSDGFRCFLRSKFGTEVETKLSRLDLGARGSHTPVVIVHGLQNCAGGYHEAFAEWARRGWTPSEIFATSYGPPGVLVDVGNILACDYVRQVRQLIVAVHAYTRSPVFLIGNSLGGPISRKAVLGGECVDTGEQLGGPLTEIVAGFLGVAGAMRGSLLCEQPLAAALPICDRRLGVAVDSEAHYEGGRVLILESRGDDWVGFETPSGERLCEVADADRTVILKEPLNHDDTIFTTQSLQFDLLVSNAPYPAT